MRCTNRQGRPALAADLIHGETRESCRQSCRSVRERGRDSHALSVLRVSMRRAGRAIRQRDDDDCRRSPLPGQCRRALRQRLHGGRDAIAPRSPVDAARPKQCGSARARDLGRRARESRVRFSPAAAEVRTGRGRRLRRRLAHQREGVPARQVRARRACARRTSTTTAASACRRPRRRACAPSASIAGLPFPVSRHRRRRRRAARRRQRRRDDAADHAVLRRAAQRRRASDRRRSTPDADRAAGDAAPAADPRHRRDARAAACCTS